VVREIMQPAKVTAAPDDPLADIFRRMQEQDCGTVPVVHDGRLVGLITANGILQHLSLLFVPAGVGVMVHFARVSGEWLPILTAVLVSTALAIAVSALVMRALMRGASDDGEEREPAGRDGA